MWLEAVRASLIANGAIIERPVPKVVEISEKLGDWQKRVEGLIVRLTNGIPDDIADRTVEEHARWLLAYVLDWHGREKKAVWWEYYRLRDLSAGDLLHERAGLAGLISLSRLVAPPKRPSIATNSSCRIPISDRTANFGASEEITTELSSPFHTMIGRSISRSAATPAGFHAEAVFTHKSFDHDEQAKSLLRLGEYVAANGMEGEGDHRAARDLLMANAPRLRGQMLQLDGEPTLIAAVRIALDWTTAFFRSRAHRERGRHTPALA